MTPLTFSTSLLSWARQGPVKLPEGSILYSIDQLSMKGLAKLGTGERGRKSRLDKDKVYL